MAVEDISVSISHCQLLNPGLQLLEPWLKMLPLGYPHPVQWGLMITLRLECHPVAIPVFCCKVFQMVCFYEGFIKKYECDVRLQTYEGLNLQCKNVT